MAPSYGPSNTERFTSRAQMYNSSRPSFPPELAELLLTHFSIPAHGTIADIGSGTGISSTLFLDSSIGKSKSVKVLGVEPNDAMRKSGDELLAPYIRSGSFKSIAGSAEATTLAQHSVDLAVSGQAFHWFDIPKARAEFKRIVREGGGVAIFWNDRRGMAQSSLSDRSSEYGAFMDAYETMLFRWSKDYQQVNHHAQVDEEKLGQFFGPHGFEKWITPNPYYYSWDELRGRLLSSSYAPEEGQEGYEQIMKDLKEIFEKYQKDGKVEFIYDTRVFYGKLS